MEGEVRYLKSYDVIVSTKAGDVRTYQVVAETARAAENKALSLVAERDISAVAIEVDSIAYKVLDGWV